MLQCDLHQNLNYGCYLWLTLESAPSDLDLLPLKAPAIIVASDLELTRKLISVTIGNVRMYARLRLRPFISFKGMKGKFIFLPLYRYCHVQAINAVLSQLQSLEAV